MIFENELKELKSECLVYDIETCAFYPFDGREIDIARDFDGYVEHAVVKWFGAYSFKHNKLYLLNAITDRQEIYNLVNNHKIHIGFNNEEFDGPIMKNNGFYDKDHYKIQTDCKIILGKSVFKTRSGFGFKDRGSLMKYKFKNNKLRTMAEAMDLETQKGDIDYKIFHKNEWTEGETIEIKKYLEGDVMSTKQMFDKLWDYWLPFTDLLDISSVLNLLWIRSSIASMTYKSACHFIGVEPTYGKHKSEKEKMGGFVLEPQVEEMEDVFICDFTSLYPNTLLQFGLFAETCEKEGEFIWHGNALFKPRGYYNISKQHPLSEHLQEILRKRIALKKESPDDPMVYCYKIFVNSLYGVVRSAIFEQVHTPNAGWDCCLLSQTINKYTKQRLSDFGFFTIYQDTDSDMVKHKDKEKNTKEYLTECLKVIIKELKNHMPFPSDTFDIKIEYKVNYIMFPFSLEPIVDEATRKLFKDGIPDGYDESTMRIGKKKKKIIVDVNLGKVVKIGRSWEKEFRGRKKNYAYIITENGEKKIVLKGLSIKKSGATVLGIKIFNEVLKPLILQNNKAKFSEEFIQTTIENYLKKPGILETLAREFKVKPASTYKSESSIFAQISLGYFNGEEGVISLIKNTKTGKAGKGLLYCSIQEAKDNNLKINELDLEKLNNELEVFVNHEK